MNLQRLTIFLVFSQAMGLSSFPVKLPRYDELFYLAAPKSIKEPNSRTKVWLSQFYNSEGRNYLDVMEYEASQSRNSKDPTLSPKIKEIMQMLVCNQVAPNISYECCKDTQEIFMGVLQRKKWALQSKKRFYFCKNLYYCLMIYQ